MVEDEVALVATHPDDEILGLGSRLRHLRRLKIIHVTDGAPRDLSDARRQRYGEWEEYADARQRELRAALRRAGASRAECLCYAYPDQQAIRHCGALVERLAEDLHGAHVVITHPYEHGHPDHDTAALAVSLSCERLRTRGRPLPERYEFASYHLRQGKPVYGAFWPDPRVPETRIPLSRRQRACKRAAVGCFASQREVITNFPILEERVRPSPGYDFGRPAPPGAALYDCWGWATTSRQWREQAARILARHASEPAS